MKIDKIGIIKPKKAKFMLDEESQRKLIKAIIIYGDRKDELYSLLGF